MTMPRLMETRPESGGSWPVSTCSRGVLPSPLRPTIPPPSPPPTPIETSVSRGRTSYAFDTRSRLTRLAIGHHVRAGHRTVRHQDDALLVGRHQRARHRPRMVGGLAQEDTGRPRP